METNVRQSTSTPEAELIEALRERRRLIADEESRRKGDEHLAALREISERIVALQEKLPPPVDPQLAHFLARCSYDKALAFLEERR